MKVRILIPGGTGQMGLTLQEKIKREWTQAEVLTPGHKLWNIADRQKSQEIFSGFKPDFVINAAAFTNVDAAEDHRGEAYRANAEGPALLAQLCEDYKATLIHYSTDYVFDGQKRSPYLETDPPDPINYYGKTKLEGEKNIQKFTARYFIIRPAWIYSGYGRNFIHLVMDLARKNKILHFVNDQMGSPTSALDLAGFTMFLIKEQPDNYGIFHYSNEGEASRYDQARAIVRILDLPAEVKPVPHTAFPQKADRPLYSVLSKQKVRQTFNLDVPAWNKSLEQVLKTYFL